MLINMKVSPFQQYTEKQSDIKYNILKTFEMNLLKFVARTTNRRESYYDKRKKLNLNRRNKDEQLQQLTSVKQVKRPGTSDETRMTRIMKEGNDLQRAHNERGC